MCNPGLALGVASSVGSAVIQNQAKKRAESAKRGYIADENVRQQGFEQRAQGEIDKSSDMFRKDAFNKGMGDTSNRLAQLLMDARIQLPEQKIASGTPRVVQDQNAMEMRKATDFANQQNIAMGNIMSLADYLNNTIQPQLNQSSTTAQLMGNFMKGSSSVLDSELMAANQKANSPLAQILGEGGKTATAYGLYK